MGARARRGINTGWELPAFHAPSRVSRTSNETKVMRSLSRSSFHLHFSPSFLQYPRLLRFYGLSVDVKTPSGIDNLPIFTGIIEQTRFSINSFRFLLPSFYHVLSPFRVILSGRS